MISVTDKQYCKHQNLLPHTDPGTQAKKIFNNKKKIQDTLRTSYSNATTLTLYVLFFLFLLFLVRAARLSCLFLSLLPAGLRL